jgi:plasmid stabilization system protein ParE
VKHRALIWSARARRDLREIGQFIARDKPVAASQWVETLAAMAEHAAAIPLAGRRVPEFGRDDVREVIKRGYRVIYRVFEDRVEIVTVREGHRRLPPDMLDN